MTATFINQRQLDAIDACMGHIESLGNAVSGFCSAAEIYQGYGLTQPPRVAMNAGATQARLWKLKTEPTFYRNVVEQIDELALLVNYLGSYIGNLSSPEKKGPITILSGIAPPYRRPKYSTEPVNDCLSLLKHHQQWMWAYSQMFEAASPGHEAIRKTMYTVLPRVLDFMSVHLQAANAKRPAPAQLNLARDHWHITRGHYFSGMGATADFLTQYQRINYLLAQASESFAGIEKVATLSRLVAGMRLIMVELKQVQRLCSEIAGLRTSH